MQSYGLQCYVEIIRELIRVGKLHIEQHTILMSTINTI